MKFVGIFTAKNAVLLDVSPVTNKQYFYSTHTDDLSDTDIVRYQSDPDGVSFIGTLRKAEGLLDGAKVYFADPPQDAAHA